MNIDDRGLGEVVYHLMMGEAGVQFFPGLNVLVKNEDQPGGLWHKLRQKEKGMGKRFLEEHPDSEGLLTLLFARSLREQTQRELCLKMFWYGLCLAPLFQASAPGGADEARHWNQFWGGGFGLPPEEGKKMSRFLAQETALLAQVFGEEPEEDQNEEQANISSAL